MKWVINALTSSIGKKIIMSFTGLFLVSFLVVHLSGNFSLFNNDGGAAFNAYSEFMSTNTVIRVMEIGLALGFLFHIIDSIILWMGQKRARGQRYEENNPAENSSFFSRYMIVTGIAVGLFLLLHLYNFFLPARILGSDHSMYDLVVEAFGNPVYSILYIIAMVFLSFHLMHAFQSAFQTLGWNNTKYFPVIKTIGVLYAIVVPLGFMTMPVYFLVQKLTEGS